MEYRFTERGQIYIPSTKETNDFFFPGLNVSQFVEETIRLEDGKMTKKVAFSNIEDIFYLETINNVDDFMQKVKNLIKERVGEDLEIIKDFRLIYKKLFGRSNLFHENDIKGSRQVGEIRLGYSFKEGGGGNAGFTVIREILGTKDEEYMDKIESGQPLS